MILIREKIPGAGDNWHNQAVIDRMEWMLKNLNHPDYTIWWADRESDIMYIRFENHEDATLYSLYWAKTEK